VTNNPVTKSFKKFRFFNRCITSGKDPHEDLHYFDANPDLDILGINIDNRIRIGLASE
jgi:hypothetical protein